MKSTKIKRFVGGMVVICLFLLVPTVSMSKKIDYDEMGNPNVDGLGRIDLITNNVIVIDDIKYKLSSSVQFYAANSKPASRSEFVEGTYVRYLFKSEKERDEIVSLWLSKKPEKLE